MQPGVARRGPSVARRCAPRTDSGAATVEHAGLSLLIALLAAAVVAALASAPAESGRELGSTLARKLRCAAVGPGPCWRDPLTLAYGRAVAGAVRALAPRAGSPAPACCRSTSAAAARRAARCRASGRA